MVVLYDQTKVHKSGSTVPIKIQIVDAYGVNYSSASLEVQAMSVVLVSANSSGTPEDAGNSNPDLNFRYDASLGGYIFNLDLLGEITGGGAYEDLMPDVVSLKVAGVECVCLGLDSSH